MQLVDTHCHIQSIGVKRNDHTHSMWQKLNLTAEQVISSAAAAGVSQFICVGCDLSDSRLALDFALSHNNCFAAIGIHPHEARNYINKPKEKEKFLTLLNSSNKQKIIAIGECGLDYFYNHSLAEDQRQMLIFQIDLALKYNLPMIFHVREAFNDFWSILDNFSQPIRGVLHSFTDNQDNLVLAIQRGLYIGVNGISTFTKDPQQLAMIKSIPLDRLLLETDAPYLTPVPYRGNINEPKHVRTVAEFLTELRGESLEQIALFTTNNAHLLFGI